MCMRKPIDRRTTRNKPEKAQQRNAQEIFKNDGQEGAGGGRDARGRTQTNPPSKTAAANLTTDEVKGKAERNGDGGRTK